MKGEGSKMSKNQMKKLAKQQKLKDTRKEWREKEKAKKKAKKRLLKGISHLLYTYPSFSQLLEQGITVKKKKKRFIEDHEYPTIVLLIGPIFDATLNI